MQNTVLLCDKNAKTFKISCVVKYPVFSEAWMHTLFSLGKNILHELFLKQKILLSFNSSPPTTALPNIPSKFGELDKYSGLCKEILVSDKNCWLGLHVFGQ